MDELFEVRLLAEERRNRYQKKLLEYQSYQKMVTKHLGVSYTNQKRDRWEREVSLAESLLTHTQPEYDAFMLDNKRKREEKEAERKKEFEEEAKQKKKEEERAQEVYRLVLLDRNLLKLILQEIRTFGRRQLCRVCKAWNTALQGPLTVQNYDIELLGNFYSAVFEAGFKKYPAFFQFYNTATTDIILDRVIDDDSVIANRLVKSIKIAIYQTIDNMSFFLRARDTIYFLNLERNLREVSPPIRNLVIQALTKFHLVYKGITVYASNII